MEGPVLVNNDTFQAARSAISKIPLFSNPIYPVIKQANKQTKKKSNKNNENVETAFKVKFISNLKVLKKVYMNAFGTAVPISVLRHCALRLQGNSVDLQCHL